MFARRLVGNHPVEHYRRRDQQRQNGHHNKQTGHRRAICVNEAQVRDTKGNDADNARKGRVFGIVNDDSVCIFICDSLRADRLRNRVDLVYLVGHHGAVRSIKGCIVTHGNIRRLNLANKHHGANGQLGLHRARKHCIGCVSKCTRNERGGGKSYDEHNRQAAKKGNKMFKSARRQNDYSIPIETTFDPLKGQPHSSNTARPLKMEFEKANLISFFNKNHSDVLHFYQRFIAKCY